LRHDISIYESHLQKTEIWIDNLGKWTTKVTGGSITNSNDDTIFPSTNSSSNENTVLFEIHVELHEDLSEKENIDLNSKSYNRTREGWIIYRSIKQFESLNESLNDLIPNDIKSKLKKLPNLRPGMLSKNFNEEKIKLATNLLDDFLRVIFLNFLLKINQSICI
jgi:hypothetical protein